MKNTCIIEIDGIDKLAAENNLSSNDFTLIRSNGLTGDVVNSAIMLTLCASVIPPISRIIIEAIRQKKRPQLKFKGKTFEFTVVGIDEHAIVELLQKLIEENKGVD